MTRTRIFVSSTYFDLIQVRENIKSTIEQLGHDPLLNEYPSFPVLPDLQIVQNCREAVRSCDLFVLIIGGRRGSLDSETGKSITNVEYETAIQSGLDCFIFVQEPILTLLQVWKKNPAADFAPHVDSAAVFEFVESIKVQQKWIFSFARASSITEILRIQLSIFLKSLLDRRRQGSLSPLPEFEHETARIQEIVRDRPTFWEYRLTAELLKDRLLQTSREYQELSEGLIFTPSRKLDVIKYLSWLEDRFSGPEHLMEILKKTLERELPTAWGPPGQAGDAILILRAVDRIRRVCREFLEWELELHTVQCSSKQLQKVGNCLRGLTSNIVLQLERVPREILEGLEGSWEGSKSINVTLDFEVPPQLQTFTAEMKDVRRHHFTDFQDDY